MPAPLTNKIRTSTGPAQCSQPKPRGEPKQPSSDVPTSKTSAVKPIAANDPRTIPSSSPKLSNVPNVKTTTASDPKPRGDVPNVTSSPSPKSSMPNVKKTAAPEPKSPASAFERLQPAIFKSKASFKSNH